MRLSQPRFQFRLTDENNLEKFLREGFQIGQQPDLFQYFVGQILCLIYDQNRGFPGPISIQQPVIQPQQDLTLRLGIAGNSEVGNHVIEELRDIQTRIEDEGGGYLLKAEPFQQFVDERRLSCPDLAGEQNKAFAALNPVGQAGQGFLG